MPPSLHYRKCDDARHWNLFMIQLLQIMNLATLEDLYEAVIANGWYPANRNAAAGPALDVHIVNAFADANGYEHPEDYRETAPTHVAMLVNWRVLRAIMTFGMDDQQRRSIRNMKMEKDRLADNPQVPKRR